MNILPLPSSQTASQAVADFAQVDQQFTEAVQRAQIDLEAADIHAMDPADQSLNAQAKQLENEAKNTTSPTALNHIESQMQKLVDEAHEELRGLHDRVLPLPHEELHVKELPVQS